MADCCDLEIECPLECTTTDPPLQPYIAPPTVRNPHPSNAYCILARRLTITSVRFGANATIPASGLQAIADAVRADSGTDSILGTVRIQGPICTDVCNAPSPNYYILQVLYPKGYNSYGYNCDITPVYLSGLSSKLSSVAERLTKDFTAGTGIYTATLAATNDALPSLNAISAFAFPDGFEYVGDYVTTPKATDKCGKPIPSRAIRPVCCPYVEGCDPPAVRRVTST